MSSPGRPEDLAEAREAARVELPHRGVRAAHHGRGRVYHKATADWAKWDGLHDPLAVRDIQQIIGFLKQRQIGVLITDHNVRETLGICDRAYIINEGAVLAYGRPDEIVYNDSVRRVYLGENFRM